jgi:hypothetical protein
MTRKGMMTGKFPSISGKNQTVQLLAPDFKVRLRWMKINRETTD